LILLVEVIQLNFFDNISIVAISKFGNLFRGESPALTSREQINSQPTSKQGKPPIDKKVSQ
jgi:hypothetical protein